MIGQPGQYSPLIGPDMTSIATSLSKRTSVCHGRNVDRCYTCHIHANWRTNPEYGISVCTTYLATELGNIHRGSLDVTNREQECVPNHRESGVTPLYPNFLPMTKFGSWTMAHIFVARKRDRHVLVRPMNLVIGSTN